MASMESKSKVLAVLVGVLELLPLFQLVEQLGILDLEQREDILQLLADNLLVHLDLGEAIDHIIFDALLIQLMEIQREQDDAFVLQILKDVQPVVGDLVDDEHAAEVVHLLLAEVDLLGQHLKQTAEIEIQLLGLLDLVEPLLVDVREVHVVEVLLGPELDLYVAEGLAAVERHYADLHHLLETLHLAAAHLTTHLDRETRLEEGHSVAALHYWVEVGHPSVLRLVVQLIHIINLSNKQTLLNIIAKHLTLGSVIALSRLALN